MVTLWGLYWKQIVETLKLSSDYSDFILSYKKKMSPNSAVRAGGHIGLRCTNPNRDHVVAECFLPQLAGILHID